MEAGVVRNKKTDHNDPRSRYHLVAADLLEVGLREISLSVHEIEDQTSWKIQFYDPESGLIRRRSQRQGEPTL